ncbi:calponin homology domain-containing protein DDB_G0272472-like isoform X2 [Ptychodera flava]|uniref:calponin homology domain-containing protein DDB_G0272472-like isoform X2 n=1 Tax=Ptychodera flava TaxID=63121 RepID=UPI00396AAB04
MTESSSVDTDELLSGIEPFTCSLTSSPQRSWNSSPERSGIRDRSRESSPIKSGPFQSSRESSPIKSVQFGSSRETSPIKAKQYESYTVKTNIHERSRESSPLKTSHFEKRSPSVLQSSNVERKYCGSVDDVWSLRNKQEKTELQSSFASKKYSPQSSNRETSTTRVGATHAYQYARSLPTTPFDRDLAASVTQRLMASLQESKQLEETRKSKSMTALNKMNESENSEAGSSKSPERSPISRKLFSQSHGVYLTSGAGLELNSESQPRNDRTNTIMNRSDRDTDMEDINHKEKKDDTGSKGITQSDDASDKTGSTVIHVPVKSPGKSETKAEITESKSQATKPVIHQPISKPAEIPEIRDFYPMTWKEKYASMSGRSSVKSCGYGFSGSIPDSTHSGAMPSSLKTESAKLELESSVTKGNVDILSNDIKDMEKVRDHLHGMLKLGKQIQNRDHFDHTRDSVHDILGNPGNSDNETSHLNEESFDSVRTDTLISAKPYNEVSPIGTLAYDSGVGLSSKLWYQSNSRSTRATDSTLYTENQLMKDRLEREMYRRKHCEKQIQQLQNKMLELQQQLAVAVSTDRKKDVMIEQLDKTLAKVVDGWKKHEVEKTSFIEKLKEEKQKAEATNAKQQELLKKFEAELSQAVEQLTKEQLRASRAENDIEAQMVLHNKERDETLKVIEMEKKRVEELEVWKNEAIKRNKKLEKDLEEACRTLDQECEHWQREKQEYQDKLKKAAEEHFVALNQEKKTAERERRAAEDSQIVLSSVQAELDKVKLELDTAKRDKENLKMEISLLEARHEASQSKQESEHQAEMEKLMADNLAEFHDKLVETEAELRETHRKQVQEINERHQEDLEQRRLDSELELTKKDARLKATTQEYEDRLEECRREIADLQRSKQKMELHKSELVAKLQTLMQSHCNEALILLGGRHLSTSQSFPKNGNNSGISSGVLSDTHQLPDDNSVGMTDLNQTSRSSNQSEIHYHMDHQQSEYYTDNTRHSDYVYEDRYDSHPQHSSAGLTTILEENGTWPAEKPLYSYGYQQPGMDLSHSDPQFSDIHYSERQQGQQTTKQDNRQFNENYARDMSNKQQKDTFRSQIDDYGQRVSTEDDSFYPLEKHNNTMETVHSGRGGIDNDTTLTESKYHPGQPSESKYHPGQPSESKYHPGQPSESKYHPGQSSTKNQTHSTVQQPHSKAADFSVLSDGPLENMHVQYEDVPVRHEESEDKQTELQYYIKLLLDRSPGSPITDQQSEDDYQATVEQYSARSMKSDSSTGSCPINRAVREVNMGHTQYPTYNNPSQRSTTNEQRIHTAMKHDPQMKSSEYMNRVSPTKDTNQLRSAGNQAVTDNQKPAFQKDKFEMRERSERTYDQSPMKHVNAHREKEPQGVLSAVQIAEVSRLLDLYRKQENQKQEDGQMGAQPSRDQTADNTPTANELFYYLRELPQMEGKSQNKDKEQPGVPKAKRNLGNQIAQRGRQQQVLNKQSQAVRQQPRPNNQLRAGQPNVQPCPHGKSQFTKTTNQQQKEKKVMAQGVRKLIRPANVWK